MLVDRIMPAARDRLLTVSQQAPLIEAARLLRNGRSDLVVVCDPNGLLSGVVTKSDIVAQISQCLGASCTTGLSSVMTRDVTSCRQKDWLHDIWGVMKERQLKNVPITDDASRPIGILNARDALQALMQEVEQEESLLRDYVMCVGYR